MTDARPDGPAVDAPRPGAQEQINFYTRRWIRPEDQQGRPAPHGYTDITYQRDRFPATGAAPS